MIEMRKQVEPGNTTPPEISVMQIDQDLKDGITKAEMAVKYNIKPWEVDEMFKHSFLKGRRPSRKKALSFKFVDDSPVAQEIEDRIKETGTVMDREQHDPRQVTLEQAIEEAIDTVEDAKQEMQEAEKAIVDMLSPTQFETPQETLQNAATNTINDLHQAVEKSGGEVISTDNDEEELEMDDDTFEL